LALLTNKVAFITGGGSGIGRACAIGFAAEGARVAIAERSEVLANEAAELVRAAGGEAIVLHIDVADGSAVEEAVRKTVETYGALDCAVNSAGIRSTASLFAEVPDDDWDAQIAVNLNGVRLSMKHQLIQMRKQGSGAIVNISSGAGITGVPRSGGYGAAKHAVVGMTRVAALDHAKEGIRVNAICPGYILTPMTEGTSNLRKLDVAELCPIGRVGQPHEIADAAVWLCSERASFVTGIALPVDGGFSA
jgi:NAD(P)-dependent dehydrogenase (short-subunit alcohol dehydrogenase family)